MALIHHIPPNMKGKSAVIQTDATIACFCCDKQMSNWIYDSPRPDGTESRVTVHPMGGLHFQTYGHYGSRAFDPMDGTALDIAICDECIIANVERMHGTGFDHAHEVALIENEEYKMKAVHETELLLDFFEDVYSDLETKADD
jgi:hypothetical protein